MKTKDLSKCWFKKSGTVANQPCTLSESYRAYCELKKAMWKNTVFNPLNNK